MTRCASRQWYILVMKIISVIVFAEVTKHVAEAAVWERFRPGARVRRTHRWTDKRKTPCLRRLHELAAGTETYMRWSDVIESRVTIRSPFCGYSTSGVETQWGSGRSVNRVPRAAGARVRPHLRSTRRRGHLKTQKARKPVGTGGSPLGEHTPLPRPGSQPFPKPHPRSQHFGLPASAHGAEATEGLQVTVEPVCQCRNGVVVLSFSCNVCRCMSFQSLRSW